MKKEKIKKEKNPADNTFKTTIGFTQETSIKETKKENREKHLRKDTVHTKEKTIINLTKKCDFTTVRVF